MLIDYGGWTMDLSVTLMMVVPRMSSYAWCYQDGGEKDENLSAGNLTGTTQVNYEHRPKKQKA